MKQLILMAALVAPIAADKILLKNGSYESGKVESENTEYIIVLTKDEKPKKINRAEIDEIMYTQKKGEALQGAPSTSKSSNPGLTLFNWITLRNFTGALTFGWQQASLSDLNGALTKRSYASAPENMFTIGGTMQVTISRIVLGLEGTWLWGPSREAQIGANTIKNSFSAFRGIGILGYLVYTSERLDIFPYIGGGLAGYNLIMTNTQNDSFDNVIATGQRGALLSSLGIMFTVGAQLVYRLPILAADKGVFGLALGLKGGYDIAVAQSDWYAGGINDLVKLSGGPRSPLTGPYAQVLLGIWFDFF